MYTVENLMDNFPCLCFHLFWLALFLLRSSQYVEALLLWILLRTGRS